MENTSDSTPATGSTDAAIRDLIKSCRSQSPNGSNCQSQSSRFIDVQHACDELLSFSFHSEDGRLQLIEKLTTLDGNFVVKIIRKGLVSLSKVYSDRKTFEEESLKLIDLCCSQSQSLKNDSGPHLASPALILDWAVALCDELRKAEEASSCSSAILISKCLPKVRDIYETMVRGRMELTPKGALETVLITVEAFKVLFQTLLSRVREERFEELIEQTVAITKTEEHLDFLKFSRISTFKQALVLSCWLDLLKLSFLSNWFGTEVAKHDFLVHDASYAQSLPFSEVLTYTESLVCQVSVYMASITSSIAEEKEFFCSKNKAKAFFEYSEIFLRHTSLCLQLMQSKEISVVFIENLFFELGINFDRALLPFPTKSELKDCDFEISPNSDAMSAQIKSLGEQSKKMAENKLMIGRVYKNSSFEALTKALLTMPDNQQVLRIVRLWKQNFPDDKSHLMLSQLLVLVSVVMEGDKDSISKNMEHLVEFLSQLPIECLRNLSLWQPTMVYLIQSLPCTWFGPEVMAFVQSFAYLANSANNRSRGNIENLRQIPNFLLNSLKGSSKPEDVKMKALKLGLELLEQVPHPEEYQFALNVIFSVASDMETDHGIKTFTLSLLKTARVHIPRIRYLEIWQVISLIDLSRGIRRKSEVFEAYLKLLQEINHDGIASAVITCRSFFQLPIAVDTDNVKRFLTLAATDEGLKTCEFILKCLGYNQTLLAEYSRVDEHVIFLISIKENMPCKRSCELFFGSVYKYMEQQMLAFPSIDIFEIILASIAGCIAVGKFVSNRFKEVLRVVQAAVRTQRMDKPNAPDVLSLFIHVAKTIGKAQRFGKKKDFADLFSRALCPIATLPLSLTQKVELMEKVTSILEQEKITDNQKLFNVMFHLFHLPSNVTASSMSSEALDLHFKEVVTPSIIRNVAEIPLMEKHDPNVGSVSLFSLMEAIVERMPETFANKTSSGLYRFIIERVEEQPTLSCSIFPIVEAITKRRVSEAKLKEEMDEIEEMLLRLPTEFMLFISDCLRECYTIGASHEEQSIKCLITQIIDCLRESDLNVEDGLRMMNSIMKIPQLLVLTFKEATTTDQAKKGMKKIFDVIKTLDPEFLAGRFLFSLLPQVVVDRLIEIVRHDFHMLLKHTSLTAADLCTAMLVYQSLKPDGLLNVFNLSTNQDFASVFQQWLTGISQPEIPTPGNLAYLVTQQLRRINILDNDIQGTTIEICCTILGNRCFRFGQIPMVGILGSPPPKQYLDMIISVLKESSYLAEIRHWLKTDCLIAVQCKDVIRAACSWGAGGNSYEESMLMDDAVSETLSSLISKKVPPHALSSLGTILAKELEVMVLVMQAQEDKDIAVRLFELLCTSTQCAEACVDVVLSWSKEQSLLLIKKFADWYKEKMQAEVNVEQLSNEIRIPLQVLPFAAKAFPNSAEDVLNFLVKTTETTGPEDHTSLGRLPVWRKQMTDAGYDSQAIQSWCTSFVLAQNSCSSDVDSLANLTPEVINVLTAEPEAKQIKQSLFCWQATQHLQTDKKVFKRCLVLARLLNEFACILGHLKENVQVVQRIQQGAAELCSTFLDDSSTMGNLYKIRYKILEDLFVLLFQGVKGEHETSLRQLTSEGRFSKSLVIIFRRLARSVVSRPVTFGHIKSVVTIMLQHKTKSPDCQDQDIQQAVHLEVLHLESNQDAIHTLQASGYNQSTSTNEDLWYSSSIQMPAYVPTVKSFEAFRKESLLRQLWREWKTLLTVHDISEVEVIGKMVKQGDLFKMSDSLEAMEAQLKCVQQAIQGKPLKQNGWSYYRQKELLRNEKRLRDKIAKQVDEVEQMTGTRWAKMVIVWENQLLESVKMCSEKIPDCYAPNGFHSEKPVICGIAVDNRILAVCKEDQGGTHTEVENVEVKLYPAGMVVFGAYCSIHPYDTEQLWAAFYKMLLEKRLVPKIFITNVSPAFDWIKQFIAPEVSSSRDINFISCCNLVPSSEDSFDYDPERYLLATHAALATSQTKELIILTPEKAAQLQIHNLKAPVANRRLLMKEHTHRVSRHLEKDRKLQEMHPAPQDRDKILKRLRTPITKAVEAIVDGDEATKESISNSIDIKRLLPHQDAPHYSNDDYSAVILDAVNTVTGDLRDTNTCYDGCQHVVFS